MRITRHCFITSLVVHGLQDEKGFVNTLHHFENCEIDHCYSYCLRFFVADQKVVLGIASGNVSLLIAWFLREEQRLRGMLFYVSPLYPYKAEAAHMRDLCFLS